MKKYNKIFTYLSVMLLSLYVLSSCTSAKTVNLVQEREPNYLSKPYVDYRLQYNDEIYCLVLTDNTEFAEEFNGVGVITTAGSITGPESMLRNDSYRIYANGNISLPFFGEVHIAGRTLSEAEELIEAKVRKAYPDAQVKVTLRNNAYYVVSDEKTGQYPLYKDNTTIYQALAMSGRPSNRIDLGKVKIVRNDGMGKSVVKTFDLRSESVIESEFYYIKPNDIIYYSTSKAAFFRVSSVQSLVSIISLPLTVLATILATTID